MPLMAENSYQGHDAFEASSFLIFSMDASAFLL